MPLHPTVLGLGFLEYAHGLKRAGATRLFPDLALGADGRYGSAYGKRFGRLLDRCRIVDSRLVFHSFRHSFATVMRNVTGNPDLVDRLMGHARNNGSETDKRYMKQLFPAIAYNAIKLLDYGLRVFGEDPSGVVHLISAPVPFVEEADA